MRFLLDLSISLKVKLKTVKHCNFKSNQFYSKILFYFILKWNNLNDESVLGMAGKTSLLVELIGVAA